MQGGQTAWKVPKALPGGIPEARTFDNRSRTLSMADFIQEEPGPIMTAEIIERVVAQRGNVLRCKGWKQESLLRMQENNLENAQDPSRLIIFGGFARAAWNWESYHAIVHD